MLKCSGAYMLLSKPTNVHPLSFAVKRCGPFPYVERSRLISFNNTVDGLAELECIEGTSFADGRTKKSFKCLSHLDWEEPGKCFGNLIKIVFPL